MMEERRHLFIYYLFYCYLLLWSSSAHYFIYFSTVGQSVSFHFDLSIRSYLSTNYYQTSRIAEWLSHIGPILI